MKQIIALQEYTDKYVSFYQGEIRNIENGIADKLIEQGIVAEHDDDSGEESSNNNDDFIVSIGIDTTTNLCTTDKTFEETKNAFFDGKCIAFLTPDRIKVYARAIDFINPSNPTNINEFQSQYIQDLSIDEGIISRIQYGIIRFKNTGELESYFISK